MARKSDPQQWTLEHGHDGYYLVDEYGEDCGFAGTDYVTAKAALDEIVREEIAAREAEGMTAADDPMRGVEFPFAKNH